MTTVELLGREGCCLCDDARALLLRLGEEIPFELREVDIEVSDELHARYLERIPVVRIDGEDKLELVINEDELRSHLHAAAPKSRRQAPRLEGR